MSPYWNWDTRSLRAVTGTIDDPTSETKSGTIYDNFINAIRLCTSKYQIILDVQAYLQIFNDGFVAEHLQLFDDNSLDLVQWVSRFGVDGFENAPTASAWKTVLTIDKYKVQNQT